MKISKLWFGLLGLALTLGLPIAPAQAQATRTWVSGVGDDANPCSRTAPCKTFAGAISKTATGGEINVLDPGGFGAVTITKPITISSDSSTAGVLVSGTNGIVVSLPGAGVVNLRGLDIDGLGTGLVGVNVLSGNGTVVRVENCQIYGFNAGAAAGIQVAPSASGATLVVLNSRIYNNGIANQPTTGGIVVTGTAGSVNAALRDVVLDNNKSSGLVVQSAGQHAGATIDRSTIAFNGGSGLFISGGSAVAIIGNSTVTGNNFGVNNQGGTLQSWKNNQIGGNNSDGTPITAFPGPGGTALQ